MLRADGLVYQDVDDLLEVGTTLNPNIKQFDAACFDGHYVTGKGGGHGTMHALLALKAQGQHGVRRTGCQGHCCKQPHQWVLYSQ